eukprot:gene740-20379_t
MGCAAGWRGAECADAVVTEEPTEKPAPRTQPPTGRMIIKPVTNVEVTGRGAGPLQLKLD